MYKLQVSVLSILLFILISCSAEQKSLDANVIIVRTYKISQTAFVKYKVKNIGEKDIRGVEYLF